LYNQRILVQVHWKIYLVDDAADQNNESPRMRMHSRDVLAVADHRGDLRRVLVEIWGWAGSGSV
jgi:hypothetical protein